MSEVSIPVHPCSIKVSIIIPARNEETNIASCLKSIIEQDYPHELMEVIICDDRSVDNTMNIAINVLSTAKLNHKVIAVPDSLSGKKKAIENAVKIASGELIIQTDADCYVQKQWVNAIIYVYERSHASMICGPVAIYKEQTLCDKFQSIEICGLSLITGAGIGLGMPVLCNGANMAYKKDVFLAVGGYAGADHIPSGDDTLLMSKIKKRYRGGIHFIKSRQAIVFTRAQSGWKAFLSQRIRWASKGFRGSNILNTAIGLIVFMSSFLALSSGIMFLFMQSNCILFIISIILKFGIDFLLLTYAANFFDKRKFLAFFPIFEMITIFYTSIVGLISHVAPYSWKGRKYKNGGTRIVH